MSFTAPPTYPVTAEEVAVDRLNPAPAYAVREGLDDNHIERLEDAYRAGADVPPVECFGWPGAAALLLAEGAHRRQAKIGLGHATIFARITLCPDEATARRLALECACGANEHPGLPRSKFDKEKAVRVLITNPDHEWISDNKAAELCRVNKALVKRLREKWSEDGTIPATSRAHASHRDYKEGATASGGYITDGKGGRIPTYCPRRHTPADRPADAGTCSAPEQDPDCNDRRECSHWRSPGTCTNTSEVKCFTCPTPSTSPAAVDQTPISLSAATAGSENPVRTSPPPAAPEDWSAASAVGLPGIGEEVYERLAIAEVETVGDLVRLLNTGETLGLDADQLAELLDAINRVMPEVDPDPPSVPDLAPDAGRRVPSWYRPGNHADPDHQFADLLNKVTALAAAVSAAMNGDDGGRLRDYLSSLGLVHHRNVIAGGRRLRPKFLGLQQLYRAVRLAGHPGRPLTPVELRRKVDADGEGGEAA